MRNFQNNISLNGGSSSPSLSPDILASMDGLSPRLFEGLTPADVNLVLSAARLQHFPAKYVVAEQGDLASHLFLVATGRARYFFIAEKGKKHILLWLPRGEAFGVAALLRHASTYIVSTETVYPSSVLVWTRSEIRNLAFRYPQLTENALSITSDYLRIYAATHEALTTRTARERVAQLLAKLAAGFGRKVPGGIELDVTNEDLAYAANVSLFTASRLLGEWSERGDLAKKRGKILLRSPEWLDRDRVS
jgi:CRP-like cAMP-binding protein